MGGRTFECLDAVINRYRKEQIVEGHTLQNPVAGGGQVEFHQPSAVSAAAEKIYATLRECRDQNMLKKIKGIKQQGYLSKKSDKTGKWKQLYFALINDGAETHLFFYDSPKKTKPKGLIDLSCAYLYQVIFQHKLFFNMHIIYLHFSSYLGSRIIMGTTKLLSTCREGTAMSSNNNAFM